MPGRDGTGPLGQGSMTGRGMGLCNPRNARSTAQGFFGGLGFGLGCRRGSGLGYGRGFGRGLGRGRGIGRAFYGNNVYGQDYRAIDPFSDKELLERRQSILEAQLEGIKETLASYQDANKE